jgi:hypothetical protein
LASRYRDPTIGGWVTVVLYFLTCASCWKTAGIVQGPEGRGDMHLWRVMSVSFVALGINKQLDLQTAMTELGRIFAYAGGWYEQRQTLQVYFIIGVAIVCVIAALILLLLARESPPQTWLAILGSMFVLSFVLIRAASFHHIDRFIGNRILGLKWNWILEISGIVMVLLGSELRRAKLYCLRSPMARFQNKKPPNRHSSQPSSDRMFGRFRNGEHSPIQPKSGNRPSFSHQRANRVSTSAAFRGRTTSEKASRDRGTLDEVQDKSAATEHRPLSTLADRAAAQVLTSPPAFL